MLFLPELTSRREHLNEEMKKQVETLESQVHDLGEQIKKANPPKASEEPSKQPSPVRRPQRIDPGAASSEANPP
jgi:hypothetical protein